MRIKILISAGCLAWITLAADWSSGQQLSFVPLDGNVTTVYDSTTGNWIALAGVASSGDDTYYSVSDNHAESWQPSMELPGNNNSANDVFGAYDSNHNTVVALWVTGTNPYPITGAYSADGGNSWTEISSQPDTNVANEVFVTYDSGRGQLVATWADYSSHYLYSLISSDGGSAWGSPNRFNMTNTTSNNVYAAYDSATENLVAGWVDSSDSNRPTSGASTDGGGSWPTVTTISDSLPGINDVFILYNTFQSATIATWIDSSNNFPYSAVSTNDGTGWNGPVQISSSVTGTSAVCTAFDPVTGLTMATWADSSQQGYYSLSSDGGASWSPAAAIDAASVASGHNVFVAFDPVSQFFLATWTDSSTTHPFYSRFSLLASSIAANQGGNLGRLAQYLNSLSDSEVIDPLALLSSEELYSALVAILPKPTPAVSAANTLFALGNALVDRGSERTVLRRMGAQGATLAALFDKGELLVASGDKTLPHGSSKAAARSKEEHYAIWAEGVGEFAHRGAQNQLPSFSTKTGGMLAGFDAYGDQFQISSAFSYANSHVKSSLERDRIDFYALALYGIGYIKDGFIEVGAWGVYNHYKQTRFVFFSGFDEDAKSKHAGWQCAPHIRIGYDFPLGKEWLLEPFASADCAVVFQSGYSEHGAAPYNMRQKGSTSELFQTSTGLNAYVWQIYSSCKWFVRMSGAYMYKKGFHLGKLSNEVLVGQPSGFSVIAYQNGQNLFAPSAEFLIRAKNGLFGALNYDGQVGSHYTSNSVYGTFGFYF